MNGLCHLSCLLHICLNPSICSDYLPLLSCLWCCCWSDVYGVFHLGAFWCHLWLFAPLFWCKNSHLIFGSQQKVRVTYRSVVFLFHNTHSLGLLLSHSCTIGLIKQRTIRELSFNALQSATHPWGWVANNSSSRPGICRNNTKKMRVMGV